MGLDLSLSCRHCGQTPFDSFNCTYNLSPMWEKIFPDHKKMLPIDDMQAGSSLPMLYSCLHELMKDPDKFKKLNPENGWGSYDTLLALIIKLIDAAKAQPEFVWRAWR